MPGIMTSLEFVKLLQEGLREVAENKYKTLPKMKERFFRMVSSDSAFEEFFNVGSLTNLVEFTGKLTFAGISPGYATIITPKEYALGVQAERKFVDDKKYAVLDGWAEQLMESSNRTQEEDAAGIFNTAFSTAFAYAQSEEGKALCSSTHTTRSGTSTASGFSNAGSSALSKTAVAATRLLMRKFRNDISERIAIGDDLALVVPDALADRAGEIVGTDKGYQSGENTKNMDYQRYEVMPYMRLDDYSAVNWFMVWKSQMKKDLVWIDRIKPEYSNNVDFQTFVVQQAVYARWGFGFLDWRWIYGHAVG